MATAAPMPPPTGVPGPPAPGAGAGDRGDGARDKSSNPGQDQLADVGSVRQNFPEAWIWSELKTAGYT